MSTNWRLRPTAEDASQLKFVVRPERQKPIGIEKILKGFISWAGVPKILCIRAERQDRGVYGGVYGGEKWVCLIGRGVDITNECITKFHIFKVLEFKTRRRIIAVEHKHESLNS